MFSVSLEIVLTIAYREAVSRRHAYLTLEHLLYALAHDTEGERILKGCGVDLARSSGTWPDGSFHYKATVRMLDGEPQSVPVSVDANGKLCVSVPPANGDAPAGDRRRYRMVKIWNGIAPGSVEVHAYDQGQAGLKVVGLVRGRN